MILTVTAMSCVFTMTSCGIENNTPETPQETETPSSSNPALKLDKPKDLKGINDACTVLKSDQLARLQQDDPEPESETSLAGSAKCTWFGDKYSTIVALGASHGIGAAQIRERANSDDQAKPTDIDGYPGARVDDLGSMCRVEVGIADDQFFSVNYTKLGGKEPEFQNGCEFAEKIASEVLKNIPDAQTK